VSWIDLQAEPILTLKQPQKNAQSTPFVRADGVTVHPNGMEVDRKGTILKFGPNN